MVAAITNGIIGKRMNYQMLLAIDPFGERLISNFSVGEITGFGYNARRGSSKNLRQTPDRPALLTHLTVCKPRKPSLYSLELYRN